MKQLIAFTFVCALLYVIGKACYKKGRYDGAGVMIDTVNNILDKQIKSDTSITKLVLINPDTSTYYLSRKTALIK